MKKLKHIVLASSIFLLFGCSNVAEKDKDTNTQEAEKIEEFDKVETEKAEETEETKETKGTKEENWEEAIGDITLTEDEFEDIDWDNIHLTKAQFDDFLNEMRQNQMEIDEEGEMDVEIKILGIEFNGDVIEYTITSTDETDFANEFARAMYILMLDGFTRQFYLNSDYSNGEQHPTIIFYDEAGSVITENNNFIEFEE